MTALSPAGPVAVGLDASNADIGGGFNDDPLWLILSVESFSANESLEAASRRYSA